MKIIKIEEAKKDKMAECAEKALKSMGKLMQYIEDLGEDGYGERDDEDEWEDDEEMGMRGGYRGGGYRGGMGMRDYDGYGMRRRSSRTGRYIR